ncbi:MAG: type I-E CRISPR-associated protein Cse1/CasA [Pseudoclavibacter sp.]|nr:type I-E CRISPR-associated protein Cse1/CasA [Pseudoclavibacter sp.]
MAAKTPPAAIPSVGEPRYDLRELPWLRVRTNEGEARLGLQRAFTDAHTIAELAEPDPLVRAAQYYFLQTLLPSVLRRVSGDLEEEDELEGLCREGLPRESVEVALAELSERLWLVHPEHPFMQEARYARTAPNGDALAINPAVPGGSTKLWFGSNRERRPLSPEDAPGALMAYWWFSPNSNARPSIDGEQLRAPGSVIGSSAANSGIRVHYRGANLLETLLRNTRRSWLHSPLAPAWARDVRDPVMTDPMDEATGSGNAVLLFREHEDGPFTRAVMGGAVRDGLPMSAEQRGERAAHSHARKKREEQIKEIKRRNQQRKRQAPKGSSEEALGLEAVPEPLPEFNSPYDLLFTSLKRAAQQLPDVVRIQKLDANGNPQPNQQPVPLTGFTFGRNLFDDLDAVFKDRRQLPQSSDEPLLRGRGGTPHYVEIRYRNATTPQFESLEWHAGGGELLDLEAATRRRARTFAGDVRTARWALQECLRKPLGSGKQSENALAGLKEHAEHELSERLRPMLDELLAQNSDDEPPADTDGLARHWRPAMRRAVLEIARETIEPHVSTATMSDAAEALSRLSRRLGTWKEQR